MTDPAETVAEFGGAAPGPAPAGAGAATLTATTPSSPLTPEQAGAALDRVRAAVGANVVGQDAVIDEVLVAFLARGHALLEGVPGTAKTLLVRSLAAALGARFGRVQFTPDLMPSDITGVSVLRDSSADAGGRRGFEFQPGPVFTDLLLADEINRAPAKTQAALLEAMQERQVTVDGVGRPLGELFTVFATQNPVEYEGTYPLPEAQLDRFLLKVRVPYPSAEAELEMLARYAAGFDAERPGRMAAATPASDSATAAPPLAPLDAATLAALRDATDRVKVAPEVREYIAAIVRATRDDPGLTLGGSPRASVALFRAARAAALLNGRDFATPDDVKDLAAAVLRHRVVVAPELEVEGRSADDVLQGVLARVKAPQ